MNKKIEEFSMKPPFDPILQVICWLFIQAFIHIFILPCEHFSVLIHTCIHPLIQVCIHLIYSFGPFKHVFFFLLFV